MSLIPSSFCLQRIIPILLFSDIRIQIELSMYLLTHVYRHLLRHMPSDGIDCARLLALSRTESRLSSIPFTWRDTGTLCNPWPLGWIHPVSDLAGPTLQGEKAPPGRRNSISGSLGTTPVLQTIDHVWSNLYTPRRDLFLQPIVDNESSHADLVNFL